jgi:PKD repeat protein
MKNCSRHKWGAKGISRQILLTLLLLLGAISTSSAQSMITCPASPVDICLPGPGQACIDLPIQGALNVSAPGATWADGKFCFAVATVGQYMFTVVAEGESANDTCVVTVNVGFGAPPMIICPTDPIKVSLCQPGEVCLIVPTKNAQMVQAAGAAYANGKLCIYADTSGVYSTVLVAANACGADTCVISAEITVGQLPTIDCPKKVWVFDACAGSRICAPLAVTGADSVVAGFGSWSGDSLCFAADTAGTYRILVQAFGKCGVTPCEVMAQVNFISKPIINAQTIPMITKCGPGQVCVDFEITGADSVKVTGGVWSEGKLCFQANSSRTFMFDIVATNLCGSTQLTEFAVPVTIKEKPIISCPPLVDSIFTVCRGDSICLPVPITGAESVSTGLGNWTDGRLCFVPDSSGFYQISVEAMDSCGVSACTVGVTVQVKSKPRIKVAQGPIRIEACFPRLLRVPVEVVDANQVLVSYGTWSNDSLLFMADTAGTYLFTVTASGPCGADTLKNLAVTVGVRGLPTISCPTDTLRLTSCGHGQLAFNMRINNYDSVTVSGGTFVDSVVFFNVDSAGLYKFEVSASNSCGTVQCQALVGVSIGRGPVISCPTEVFDTTVCQPMTICRPLDIQFATDVYVTGGTYKDGELCFSVEQSGQHVIPVYATSACGAAACSLKVNVTVGAPPVILCDAPEPELVVVCRPETTSIKLVITGADSVKVTNGGKWVNGRVYFFADTTGFYHFSTTAFNACGSVGCTVSAQASVTPVAVPCFTTTIDTIHYPLRVSFENCTTQLNSTQFTWEFGDDSTSHSMNPVHWYSSPGCYTVRLIASVDFCGSDTLSRAICVGDQYHITPTDQWIDVYCGQPTLNGQPLAPGTVITAYDPNGVLCGMSMVRADGSFGFMPIYGDDIFTPQDEGAQQGDVIKFRVNGAEVFTASPVIWGGRGQRTEVCSFSTRNCHTLHLKQGWNLVSWNVSYADSISSAIAPISSCVDAVLGFDRGGLTFDPALVDFSTLKNVDYHEGYWFHMKCDADLELCGMPISPSDGIGVHEGWNLVSYWPDSVYSVAEGFGSILNNLLAAYGWDNGLLMWLPNEIGFNTLVTVGPGLGYWVKLSSDGALNYPGFGGTFQSGRVANAGDASVIQKSRTWLSVFGSHISVDGSEVASGAAIETYTCDGLKCGGGTYDNGVLRFTPVYGFDDASETTSRYPKDGDTVFVKVNGSRVYPDLVWQGNGARIRLSELISKSDRNSDVIPERYSLSQNYPNPFNPTTQISFALPVAGHAKVEIFNVTGQMIRTLVDGSMAAGTHVMPWDATDDAGNQVAGGVYFYRLVSGSYNEARKMVLLK